MGETRHEIFRTRQDGDHPAGRAITFAKNSTHAVETPWHSQIVLFTAGTDRDQRGGPEGLADPALTAGSGLEPASQRLSATRLSTWRWISRNWSPRELAVRFTDETEQFCRLGGLGLSAAESARSYYQPGLHRHQSGRGVQGQDHGPQPSSGRLTSPISRSRAGAGAICSTVLDDFSRFTVVAWKLCADHEGEGRHRHPRSGVGDTSGLDQHDRCSPTAPAVG